jgi:hypothetical protein
LLDHLLAAAYAVGEEVLVGKMPLRVDLLLSRREFGQLSEASQRDLSALVPLLNRFTLLEFKGPTDRLESGDLGKLFGCAFLWHSQQPERIPREEVSLVILAPGIDQALRDEAQSLGCQIVEQEPGIHRLSGAPFTTWLLETDVMADRGQPILSLVSGIFLRDHERIIDELTKSGHASLLYYVLQQVQQFRRLGKDFAMQHTDTEYLDEVEEELRAAVLQAIPVERRLQGLSPEERVQGLSPEELAAGLSKEQAARLRELLERRVDEASAPDKG